MNEDLRAMLDNLKRSNNNDLHTRVAMLEVGLMAMLGKQQDTEASGISPGVNENGVSRTTYNGMVLEETINNADAQQINWWLPLTLADDNVTYIWCQAIGDINGDKCLVIGGSFLRVGGVSSPYIALYRYSTRQWETLGATPFNGIVYSLAIDGSGNLYAGGAFTNAGGDANADYIAKWNGSAWSALGATPLVGGVLSLAIDGSGNLYAGGAFTNAGGDANADYIAKWNGSAWSALGSDPLTNQVFTIDIDALGYIYQGGPCTDLFAAPRDGLTYYDGSSWSSLTNAGGVGVSGNVYSVLIDDDTNTVYAAGDFDTAGTIKMSSLAAFVRPLADALDIIAGLFEQYQARSDAKYAATANGVTNGDAHNHSGGDGGTINHAALSNIGTNDHSAIDTFIASKAAASGLASLDANSLVVQAIQRILSGTAAVTATEGYAEWQSTSKRLLLYDAQRERALSSIGWTPVALPLIYDPSAALTTAYSIAANGGTLAIPILVTGHMLLQGVTVRNTDTASARSWRWHLYEQYLNNGNGAENTLTRVDSGNGNDSFTAAAASNRTLNATNAPVYLAPGVYWLAIQNVHATNTFGLGSTAAGSAFAPNSAQSKTLTVPLSATLDMVAATWTKLADIYGVRLNGRVFGQTTAF